MTIHHPVIQTIKIDRKEREDPDQKHRGTRGRGTLNHQPNSSPVSSRLRGTLHLVKETAIQQQQRSINSSSIHLDTSQESLTLRDQSFNQDLLLLVHHQGTRREESRQGEGGMVQEDSQGGINYKVEQTLTLLLCLNTICVKTVAYIMTLRVFALQLTLSASTVEVLATRRRRTRLAFEKIHIDGVFLSSGQTLSM